MTTPATEELLAKLETVPPLPAQVNKVVEMSQDPETDDNDYAKVLSSDQVLASRVLKVANSAFYGNKEKVTTVIQAIGVIGYAGIRNLAMSMGLIGMKFGGKMDQDIRTEFWRHTVGVATCSRNLAKLFKGVNADEAFVAGVLHDIGKLVFLEFEYEKYMEVWQKVAVTGSPLHEVEQEVFGIDHTSIGLKLCQKWKIPAPLDRAVGYHQNPIDRQKLAGRDTVKTAVTRAADNLTRVAAIGFDGESNVGLDYLMIIDQETIFSKAIYDLLAQLRPDLREVEYIFDMPKTDLVQPSSFRLNVCLNESDAAEALKMALTCDGHQVCKPPSVSHLESSLDPVVLDESVPSEIVAQLQGRGVNILNFGAWSAPWQAPITSGLLNLTQLKMWLGQELAQCTSLNASAQPTAEAAASA